MKKKNKDLIKNTAVALFLALAPVIVQNLLEDKPAAPVVTVQCSK